MIPVSIERNVMDINKTLYRVSKEIIETDISNIDDFIYSTEKFFRKQLTLGTMTEQNLRDFAKSCPLYWE